MTKSFDLFWSFRSPYCYFALDRVLAMRAEYDLDVNLRPVYPMAVRDTNFFKSINPKYRRYHTLDCLRVADYLGVPFKRARPDPIVMDMETNAIAAEQPYIQRLTRLGAAACLAGRGMEFLDQVARLLWDGSVDGWDQGGHLADAIARAGLNMAEMEAAITTDPAPVDDLIAANQAAHDASDHWGTPLMTFEGETFYGQDRLDHLLWRMRENGLRSRQD